jgi:hypothetical protein
MSTSINFDNNYTEGLTKPNEEKDLTDTKDENYKDD